MYTRSQGVLIRTFQAARIEVRMGQSRPLMAGVITGALILAYGFGTGQVVAIVAGVGIILLLAVFARASVSW